MNFLNAPLETNVEDMSVKIENRSMKMANATANKKDGGDGAGGGTEE